MAVNALVIRNGIPVPVSREHFLHMDEGLTIEIDNNNDYKAKGKVYLTNYRLLFLKRAPSRRFSSFTVPYANITKHKYNKKLLGGPVISITCKTIVNGGLHNEHAKIHINCSDTNTGKAFYSLFEKEIHKFNQNKYNEDRYKKILNTPSLSVEEIFPDQYAAYKRTRTSQNIVLKNQKHAQQIIVGQSAADAPMQLTTDYRAQKAKLFSSHQSKTKVSGPISGASPVNVNAFTQHRTGRTVIQDETNRYSQHDHPQTGNLAAAPASSQYNAYVDPSNPDDIVLSVPVNDEQFDQEDEGKANINANGYMYDIGQKYEAQHPHKDIQPGGVKEVEDAPKKAKAVVAVPVGDDDFVEEAQVDAYAIGNEAQNNNNNNNNNEPHFDYDDLFAQKSNASKADNADIAIDDYSNPFLSSKVDANALDEQLLPKNNDAVVDDDDPWAD